MDYNTIIELDLITAEDCFYMYKYEKKYAVICDGRVVNFEEEG